MFLVAAARSRLFAIAAATLLFPLRSWLEPLFLRRSHLRPTAKEKQKAVGFRKRSTPHTTNEAQRSKQAKNIPESESIAN
jgi:hypothetical protein